MKYAESILLSGQLISAEEANYITYKELLCRCPECKEAVFLTKEHERKSSFGKM